MNLRDHQLVMAGQLMITPRARLSASPGLGAFVAVLYAMKQLGMQVTVVTPLPLVKMREKDLEYVGVPGAVTTRSKLGKQPPGTGALIVDACTSRDPRLPDSTYDRVVYIVANDAVLPNGFYVEPLND